TGSEAPWKEHSGAFGPYEILAKISEGATGKVYLAQRQPRGEAGLFAIKVIERGKEDERLARIFLEEARVVSRLRRKNVVGSVDAGAWARGQYLVMDYVEGCSLAEIQRRHRDARPPRLIAPVLVDALHGLHAAHSIELANRHFTTRSLLIGIDGTCRVARVE